jgi:hypothetical protein
VGDVTWERGRKVEDTCHSEAKAVSKGGNGKRF